MRIGDPMRCRLRVRAPAAEERRAAVHQCARAPCPLPRPARTPAAAMARSRRSLSRGRGRSLARPPQLPAAGCRPLPLLAASLGLLLALALGGAPRGALAKPRETMATQFFANGVDVFGRPPKCRGCHEIVGNMKQALEPRVRRGRRFAACASLDAVAEPGAHLRV